MALCQARLPARDFLSRLGVQGNDYADTKVLPLGRPQAPQRLVEALWSPTRAGDEEDSIVPEELCETPARPIGSLCLCPTPPRPYMSAVPSPIPELRSHKSPQP